MADDLTKLTKHMMHSTIMDGAKMSIKAGPVKILSSVRFWFCFD